MYLPQLYQHNTKVLILLQLNISDHSQRWTFTFAKNGDNGDDLPPGIEDWSEARLESGLYFVMNQTNSWFRWNQSTVYNGALTTYPMRSNLPKSNAAFFNAAAVSSYFIYESVGHWPLLNLPKFIFSRNDDGSYFIANWHRNNDIPIERFLQVTTARPSFGEAKSKCHLYHDRNSNSYMYVIDISPQKSFGFYLRYAAP
jgi:hypothetical protein